MESTDQRAVDPNSAQASGNEDVGGSDVELLARQVSDLAWAGLRAIGKPER